ncbi:MAG: 1-(5-phosphoribosyl)-5-[(5-phosphoribosylamino)methylideneamino] imidazole-4-carboxamide isomerase [Gemmatimonadota bacterium]|nr:1-(5-phosphoribosyl)-5-[(5-phosphoribosylamino)methylideneamino] imidazole-4-carboxamide isomerase [Gemmatimonadota bacterium]
MKAIPAVDLREGCCVQLVGGSYAEERVRLDDPVAVARHWGEIGFSTLHVVDLDAALGQGDNVGLIARILALPGLEVSVGGGVRTGDQIDALLEAGASRVVVGTRAIEDPEWLEAMAAQFPRRLIVAADVRGREIVTRGWTIAGGIEVAPYLILLEMVPLAGVLVTAVHQEGRLAGPDLPLIRDCVSAASVPLIASGGIASIEDIRALQGAGAASAVLGMALYTGAVDPAAVAREFAA